MARVYTCECCGAQMSPDDPPGYRMFENGRMFPLYLCNGCGHILRSLKVSEIPEIPILETESSQTVTETKAEENDISESLISDLLPTLGATYTPNPDPVTDNLPEPIPEMPAIANSEGYARFKKLKDTLQRLWETKKRSRDYQEIRQRLWTGSADQIDWKPGMVQPATATDILLLRIGVLNTEHGRADSFRYSNENGKTTEIAQDFLNCIFEFPVGRANGGLKFCEELEERGIAERKTENEKASGNWKLNLEFVGSDNPRFLFKNLKRFSSKDIESALVESNYTGEKYNVLLMLAYLEMVAHPEISKDKPFTLEITEGRRHRFKINRRTP